MKELDGEDLYMNRKIVNIDKEKCNGCGLCVKACHEGAIIMVDGKATILHDMYCDGLGDCLPECPTGAITIVERETVPYNEEAVERRQQELAKEKEKEAAMPCGCPGTHAKQLKTIKMGAVPVVKKESKENKTELSSQLMQWPVQLRLVNSRAEYFKNANLLVAADCTAYAYANFHNDFIKDHITVIGCPKLDDIKYYEEKLAEILNANAIKSITVVRMEVPCCSGIVSAVKNAMLKAQKIVPYKEVTVGIDGQIVE